jgi:hypothetical protein
LHRCGTIPGEKKRPIPVSGAGRFAFQGQFQGKPVQPVLCRSGHPGTGTVSAAHQLGAGGPEVFSCRKASVTSAEVAVSDPSHNANTNPPLPNQTKGAPSFPDCDISEIGSTISSVMARGGALPAPWFSSDVSPRGEEVSRRLHPGLLIVELVV